MNGLDPAGVLVAGTVIKLPGGAPVPARSAEPAPAAGRPGRHPAPTAARLGAADIQSVASQYGVSPSLAAAIAWQESGFNNAMVSSANARGVMQVMPGTWDYVQRTWRRASSTPPRRPTTSTPACSTSSGCSTRPAATRARRSPATTRACSRSATAASTTTPRVRGERAGAAVALRRVARGRPHAPPRVTSVGTLARGLDIRTLSRGKGPSCRRPRCRRRSGCRGRRSTGCARCSRSAASSSASRTRAGCGAGRSWRI